MSSTQFNRRMSRRRWGASAPPPPPTTTPNRPTPHTKRVLKSVEGFANIFVRTNPDGSVLRLSDVARLELGAANLDRETHFNGGAAPAGWVYQYPRANGTQTFQH